MNHSIPRLFPAAVRRAGGFSLAALFLLLAAREADAQTAYYWVGRDTSPTFYGAYWTYNNNFSSTSGGSGLGSPGIPSLQNYLNFDGAAVGGYTSTNDFAAGSGGFQIYFKSGAPAYNLYGNSITFYDFNVGGTPTDPNIQNEGATVQTIHFPIVDGNTHGVNGILNININPGGAGPLVFNGPLSALDASVATRAINISNTAAITFNGVISDFSPSGKIALTQLGANTITLTSSNTYSGQTTLASGGTLNINNATAIGTGTLALNGSATIDNTSGAPITLANNNPLTLSGGSLTFTGTTNLNFGTGTVTVSGANRTVTVSANTLTLGGGVTDAGGARKLTKAGAGTLILNGAAGTWTGGSSLDAGTLVVGNDTALGTGNLALNGSTSVLIAGSGARTLANNVTMPVSAIIGGTNNLTLTGGFTNTTASHTLTIANTGTTTLAGNIFLADDNVTARTVTITNVGPVIISGSISNNAGGNTVASSLTWLGTNTLTLSGSNNFTGTTTISGGTLVAAHPNAFTTTGGVTFNGTTGTTTLDVQTDGGDAAYPISFGSSTVGSTVASDVKTGSVGINHTLGSLNTGNATLNIVSGPNVASGSPAITFGTTSLSAGTAGTTVLNPSTASLSLGAVSIASGSNPKTLQLDGTNTGNTITGIIANGLNTLSITKSNTGTWTLSGANSYSGTTTVGAGTLVLNGAAKSTTGILTMNGGTVDLGADLGLGNSTMINGAGGTINATGSGKILINNAAGDIGVSAGGTLTVNAVIANGSQSAVDFYNVGGGTVILNATNTFTGAGNIQSAIVSVNKINDNTVAGALGTFGTISIGAGTTAATLKYTGTGETNNRILNLAGTTGGAILDQSGSGPLKFSTNIVNTLGIGAKTLTLQGSTAGTGEIAGAITNSSSGFTSLFKTGSGTWILSGANAYSGSTVVRSGTLTLSGSAKPMTNAIYVVDNNAASTTNARVNISSDFSIGQLWLGDRAGAGQVGAAYQTAGTVTLFQAASIDNLRIGSVASGQGYYNLSGGSVSANEIGLGASQNGTIGIMDITGGTLTTPGWLTVGRGGTTSSGILNVSGAGAVNLTGTLDNTRRFRLNWAGTAGAQSVVTVSGGGTITGPTSGVSLSTLTLDLSGANTAGTLGAVNLLTGGTIQIFGVTGQNANPTCLLNFNGGTLKATAANAGFITDANIDGIYVYTNGATIDDNGVAITISRPLLAPTGNGVNGITSFTGGAGYVGAPMVTVNRGAGDTTGTGATAIAQIDSSTGGPTSGQVTNVVITNPGFNYTATPTFTLSSGGPSTAATITGAAPTANISGGLTKKGSGTLTLTGTNTYTGPTIVSNGTLAVSSSLTTTGAVSVIDGATLAVTVAGISQFSPSAVTLGSVNGGTNTFIGLISTNLAPVKTSTLTLNGVNVINITNVAGLGIYPLITVANTNIVGTGRVVVGTLPKGVTATVLTNGSSIALNVTGFSHNTWFGAVNGNWDIATTFNWTNGIATNYADGDNVLFNDLSSVTNINVAVTVSPGSMTFSNTAKNYTFTNGIIAGTGSLTKNGTATLSLLTNNTYSSGTILNAGTLLLGANSTPTSGTVTSGPLGTGILILNGGTFGFIGGAFTIANNVSVGGSANIEVASGQNEVLNGNWSGSGNLTLIANGTTAQWQFGGDNSGYTGTFTENSGNTSLAFNSASAGSANAAWVFNNPTAQRTRLNFGAGTINFGSISGNGSIANVAGSGASTMSVGALNTSTTFSGIIGDSSGQAANINLVKAGTGTFTLTGANPYTGATTITGGRLAITTANLTGAGAITVNDAGRLNLTVGSVLQMPAGTVTLGSVTGSTNEFAGLTSTNAAPINATNLTLNGANVINIIGGGFVAGRTYPLIAVPAPAILGTGGIQLGSVPAGLVATLGTNVINGTNTIALTVTAVGSSVDVWSGQTSGLWNTVTTGNWTNGGMAVVYADGDNVQFDDTASTFTVTAVSSNSLPSVNPGSLTVSNNINAYTFNGIPIVAGTLTKNGSSSLTINTVNTGYGSINLNAGSITQGNAASLGLGTLTMSNGTTFSLPNNGSTFAANPIVIAGGSSITLNSPQLGNGISGPITGDSASTVNISVSVSFNATTPQFDTFLGTVNVPSGNTLRFSNTSGNNGGSNTVFVVNGTLQPRNVSVPIALGAVSGSGTLGGAQTPSAGTVTYNIGSKNLSTTFSGKIVDANFTGTNTAVIKSGSGTWTLSGTNNYSGATTVNAGSLIGVTGGSCSNSAVTINTGATNGVSIATTGGQWVCTNLTYAAGTEYVSFAFGTTPPSTTTAPLLIQNNLTISGTLNVLISGNPMPLGTYPLIRYTNTLTGAPVLTPASMPARTAGYITNDTANKLISLVVTNTQEPLVWQPGDGLWDTATANWKDQSGTTTSYVDPGDSVLFNETPAGSGPFTVTNNSSFTPASVTVSNLTKQYTLAGSGGITGAASLTKSGAGTAVLLTANSYTGGTVINAGVLQGNTASLPGAITDNGALVFDQSFNGTNSGGISGSGTVTKLNSGTLTIATSNSYAGGTAIKAGTLSFSSAAGLGTGAATIGDATVGADATLLLTANVTATNNLTVSSGAGARTIAGNSASGGTAFSGAIAINKDVTVQQTANGGMTLSGAFSGSGSVTATNAGSTGIIFFTGPSSPGWTGPFIITAGLVRPAGTSPFNTNTVLSIGTANSASINFGGNNNMTFAGVNDIAGATGGTITGGFGTPTLNLRGAGSYAFSGTFSGAGFLNVALQPGGSQILSGTNTYAGTTVVNGGTLLINGSTGTNTVTVGSGGTLAGTGLINGATAVQFGGTVQSGAGGDNIATLTISNSLTLAGNAKFNLNRTNAQNASLIAGLASVNYGGTLTVTNVGDALQNGDTFTLFAAGAYGGGFTNFILPALTGSLIWNTNNLAVNGSITVVPGISPSALALSSSSNPSGYLDALTFTATVTPTNVTGSVTFYNGATPISTNAMTLGVATSASISSLARGTNTITATYLGDVNYYGSTNTLAQVVTNHPPVATLAGYYRGAVPTWKILLTDIVTNVADADSDTITVTSPGTSTNGVTLTTGGGFVLYYNTNIVNDQFTYTFSDGNGGTNTGTVNLTAQAFITGQNASLTISGSTATLNFAGIPGFSYTAQRSTNLTVWADILTTNAPSGGLFQIVDDFSDLGFVVPVSAYYRLQYNP